MGETVVVEDPECAVCGEEIAGGEEVECNECGNTICIDCAVPQEESVQIGRLIYLCLNCEG